MAASGVIVSCSGAVLSSLLYEQLRSGHAQEGFLLGQVQSHISEHISDSQICNEKTETVINLSSFLPCTMIGSFYSGAGILNNKKLTNYLGSELQHIIGWYRCRGSSCEDLYVRETLVHQQLSAVMTHTGGHFILGILYFQPSGDNGTFTVNHKFMMLQNRRFEGIPLQVVNIGDTSTSDYLQKPQNPALYTSTAVQSVLSKINSDEPGVQEAETIHTGLLMKLETLLPKFSNAQEDVEKVLKEVIKLRDLCNINNIRPDFTPEEIKAVDMQNLMDFDEIPSSPTTPSQTIRSSKHTNTKGSLLRKGSGRVKDREEKDTHESTDPFGFVNTEMEKLQVKTRGSPISRGSRSRTNTPSPVRVLAKSKSSMNTLQRTPSRRSSESAGSNEGSPMPANKRYKENTSVGPASSDTKNDSQEAVSRGKPKPNRAFTRTVSKEGNSPAKNTRSRSPCVTTPVGNKSSKSKVQSAWSDKFASDSQEF